MQLTNDQTPRVWSLLVTVFGEMAQQEGARIKGSVISRLTSLMGIKPEAMRVALHRLRKDGWIHSERIGRTSVYSLTDWGRTQSAQATPRIYDLQPVPEKAWLVLFDPRQTVREYDIDGTWITSSLLITTVPPASNQTFVTPILPDQPLPDWMTNRVCNPEIVQATQELHDRLNQLQIAIQHVDPLDCLEISAIRILIVDSWRRIALKTPLLPGHVFPKAWVGQPCRKRVVTLLGTYKKQDLDVLEAAV
jgi:phenylacetic acid degradation operon negative regulatory protein